MNRSSAPGSVPGLPQPAERSQTQPDIRASGAELFGERWQEPLAHLLGVNLRTVQRWANRQNEPPPAILARMGELLAVARRSRADAAADRARQQQERAAE